MKLILFLILIFLLAISLIRAQDVIILKGGNDSIHCKIIEDNIISIKYKLKDDSKTYSINAIEVDSYLKAHDQPSVFQEADNQIEKHIDYNDLIIDKTNGDTIFCKILKEDTTVLFYEIFLDSVYTISYNDIHHYVINKEKQDVIVDSYTAPKTYPLPESMLNFEAGTGVVYGGWFGARLVLGVKNSGITAGVGLGKHLAVGFDFGIQLGISHAYFSIGYGVVGYMYDDFSAEPLYSPRLTTGGMIPLDKCKTAYLSLGFTYGYTFTYISYPSQKVRNDLIIPQMGIGFRF